MRGPDGWSFGCSAQRDWVIEGPALRSSSGGRLAAKLASESGSLDAANRLYPGVEMSISIALPSTRDVDIVATFHCVPVDGSRRMSVRWNPGFTLGACRILCCREGDCPGLLRGDPARSWDGRGGNAGLWESRLCRPADKASYLSFQDSSPRPARALHRFVFLTSSSPDDPFLHGSSLGGTGGRGRRGTAYLATESSGALKGSLSTASGASATGVPANDIFSAETWGIGTGRRGNGGGAAFSSPSAALS